MAANRPKQFVIELKPQDAVMAQKLTLAFPEGLRFLVNATEVGTVNALRNRVQDVLREHGLVVENWGIYVGNVYEKPNTDNLLNIQYLNTGQAFPEGNSFAVFYDLTTIVVEISKPLVLYYIEQRVPFNNPEWVLAAERAGFEVPVVLPPNAAAPAARRKQNRKQSRKRKHSRRN